MALYSRAIRHRQIDDYLMTLAITHNPYARKMQAGNLGRMLRAERARLQSGARPKPRGIQVSDLSALGPIKKVMLTREEFLARQRPMGAPGP